MQPRSSGGSAAKSPEEVVIESCTEFAARIPALGDPERDAHEDTYAKTEDGIVSLGVFHGQEFERFSVLVAEVRTTLGQLEKAVKGFVVMSAELEDMFNCFNLQKVPGLWSTKAYPCLKPLNSWFADFVARLEMVDGWLREGPPSSFWVPAFFFPQGFITASLQVYARATHIAIDTLAFLTNVTQHPDGSSVTKAAETGNYVHGLFFEGCGFDPSKTVLCESAPRTLYTPCPVVWMKPLLKIELRQFISDRYQCPVYKTSERRGTLSTTGHSTNFVLWMHIPTDVEDVDHWVRRGVCLLCMLDD